MTNYVLTLAVGPVQGFIASARRSRDLWAGSWLLSELAKAVAKNLYEQNAELIFPFIENRDDLEPNSEFSVGNKIQVVITADSVEQLKQIADDAKAAANNRFKEIANQVKKDLDEQGISLRENHLWDCQVDDYVEVQYAWAKIVDNNEDSYHAACETVSRLLSARKVTRDFLQSKAKDKPDSPIRAVVSAYDSACRMPKSSLDGARETVLPNEPNSALRKKLGLSQSEQLDCVGVVKRLYGETFHSKDNKKLAEQFTPVTRVAADSWLRQIPKDTLDDIAKIYEELVHYQIATRVSGNGGIYSDFPYDAQLLYRFRLDTEIAQAKKDNAPYLSILTRLKEKVKIIWEDKKYGEPCPYYAMLLADGDKMGELLDKAKTKENHQDITKKLSEFAKNVPEIMRNHQAQYIYSGGDDVLGLIALSNARKCAKNLKDEFSSSLRNIAIDLIKKDAKESKDLENLEEKIPSLSVGLAICHIMTPLGAVRTLAKHAEKVAKGDNMPKDKQRNALGITLAIRSGVTTDMRLRWSDKAAQRYFKFWIKHYSNYLKHDVHGLSSRIAYDCRDIFIRTDFSKPDTDLQDKIRVAEFDRMLEKAQTRDGKPLSKRVKTVLRCRLRRLNNNLNDLATELIIARWLSAKTQRDLGRDN